MNMTQRMPVRISALVGALALFGALAPGALADHEAILEYPLESDTVWEDPGTVILLTEVAVPDDLVDHICSVEVHAENNGSVHPGNDLVIASGDDEATLVDVEEYGGKVTSATAEITLGTTASITLHMGEDGIFSAGAGTVVLDCRPLVIDASTTTSSTTTTTSSTTTLAPTTSTAAAVTTTTVQTEVLPQVVVAPSAQAVDAVPSFTG